MTVVDGPERRPFTAVFCAFAVNTSPAIKPDTVNELVPFSITPAERGVISTPFLNKIKTAEPVAFKFCTTILEVAVVGEDVFI